MGSYENLAEFELKKWKLKMQRKPNILQNVSKATQRKVNDIFPEKYHELITSTIKNFLKAVLYGTKYLTKTPLAGLTLEEREKLVAEKIKLYKNTATLEGAATGAGGIVAGIADFPLLLSIKIKFLYDVASIYGYNVDNYTERLYILHIFQLAFSSQSHVNEIFNKMENWDDYIQTLPDDINEFDWRVFQQEYRDYLDIAKMLQMLPGIGAFVGSYVNYNLLKKLGETAVNSYRMRYFK